MLNRFHLGLGIVVLLRYIYLQKHFKNFILAYELAALRPVSP